MRVSYRNKSRALTLQSDLKRLLKSIFKIIIVSFGLKNYPPLTKLNLLKVSDSDLSKINNNLDRLK